MIFFQCGYTCFVECSKSPTNTFEAMLQTVLIKNNFLLCNVLPQNFNIYNDDRKQLLCTYSTGICMVSMFWNILFGLPSCLVTCGVTAGQSRLLPLRFIPGGGNTDDALSSSSFSETLFCVAPLRCCVHAPVDAF